MKKYFPESKSFRGRGERPKNFWVVAGSSFFLRIFFSRLHWFHARVLCEIVIVLQIGDFFFFAFRILLAFLHVAAAAAVAVAVVVGRL